MTAKSRVAQNGRLLVGSAFYQAVWFAAVLSAGASSRWWWSAGASAVFLCVSLCVWPSLRKRVLCLSAAALACGLLVDTAMIATGVFASPRMLVPAPLPPLWLLMLWLSFGTYIALSLEMLYGRYWLTAVAGACGGMLAYRGGALFGAIAWGMPIWLCTLALMLVWAIVFPLLVSLATWMRNQECRPVLPRRVVRVALM